MKLHAAHAHNAAIFAVIFCTAEFTSASAQIYAIKTAFVRGTKLVVRYGDDVVKLIDDVTKADAALLRAALDGVDDVGVYAAIAKARYPAQVGERTLARLQSVADDLAKVAGAPSVMRLMLVDNPSVVKGALGELELAGFLVRRKHVIVTSMREVVETGIGKTDIDIAFTYKGKPVILERKAIDGLALSEELRSKIDKMAELARARNSIPVLAAGEISPSGELLRYASSKGVTVTHGGYLEQCRMFEDAIEATLAVQ